MNNIVVKYVTIMPFLTEFKLILKISCRPETEHQRPDTDITCREASTEEQQMVCTCKKANYRQVLIYALVLHGVDILAR